MSHKLFQVIVVSSGLLNFGLNSHNCLGLVFSSEFLSLISLFIGRSSEMGLTNSSFFLFKGFIGGVAPLNDCFPFKDIGFIGSSFGLQLSDVSIFSCDVFSLELAISIS